MKRPFSSNPQPGSGSNQQHTDDGKREIKGEIEVRGKVEVDIPPVLVDEYRSSSHQSNAREGRAEGREVNAETRDRRRFWVEVTTVGLVAIYAGLTAVQTHQAIQSTNAATKSADAAARSADSAVASYQDTVRPYLGNGVAANIKGRNLQFQATFKNYGPIPGESTEVAWEIVLDGRTLRVDKSAPDTPSTVPPTVSTFLIGELGIVETPPVLSGKSKLVIYLRDSYHWRDKTQKDCGKYQYYPMTHSFFDLGPICYPN